MPINRHLQNALAQVISYSFLSRFPDLAIITASWSQTTPNLAHIKQWPRSMCFRVKIGSFSRINQHLLIINNVLLKIMNSEALVYKNAIKNLISEKCDNQWAVYLFGCFLLSLLRRSFLNNYVECKSDIKWS